MKKIKKRLKNAIIDIQGGAKKNIVTSSYVYFTCPCRLG